MVIFFFFFFKIAKFEFMVTVHYREKLGNGEHLSLEGYKYKENNIYVIIIM